MASPATGRCPATLRLLSDYKAVQDDPAEGISAAPQSDDNLFIWDATIFGPEECIWEGGIFPLTIKFTQDYPSKPPQIRFKMPLFHPNIYPDGSICLDIIQDKWSPIYNVNSILLSIRSLLMDPNPSSPANPAAAQMLRDNPKEYKKRVKKCVEKSQEEAYS